MDLSGNQTQAPNHPVNRPGGSNKKKFSLMSLRTASVGLIVSIAILILAVASYAAFGSSGSQSRYVDGDKMQAVFLNGGQVYFGRIRNLNDSYLRLTDIYYLRVNQQVQPEQSDKQATATPVLVPLGCELHRPQNEMIINRDQVVFWENLKDGQPDNTVPGAVKKYLADNPDGQKCDTGTTNQSSGSGASTTTEPTTKKEDN